MPAGGGGGGGGGGVLGVVLLLVVSAMMLLAAAAAQLGRLHFLPTYFAWPPGAAGRGSPLRCEEPERARARLQPGGGNAALGAAVKTETG